MDVWIAPRLTDGLGNRLFQIAAAIKKARETNLPIYILLPQYTKHDHGCYEYLYKLCPKISIKETCDSWDIIEEHTWDKKIIKGTVLKGYFQDLKFFPDIYDPLLPSLPNPPNIYFENKVAVHFRFGDYCFFLHHQVDLKIYYIKAFNQFPNATFVLFSDSPERLPAIQEEMRERGYINVELSNSTTVEDTLIEMASCKKGFIGAHSTFSWWAAFLSWKVNPELVAYFPDTWMEEKKPNLFTLPFTRSLTLY